MFKIVTFNIANSRGDELQKDYRFGKRLNSIIDELKNTQADIICLQELRTCLSDDNITVMQPTEIAGIIARDLNMAIATCDRCSIADISYWQVTLYNFNKLFHLKSELHWINQEKRTDIPGTPYMFGTLAMLSRFAPFIPIEIPRESGMSLNQSLTFHPDKTFSVINIHFPTEYQDKMHTAHVLANLDINNKTTDMFKIILGDFNTFKTDYQQIMNVLADYTELLPNGDTFTSFPHDRVQITSKLDHIICKGRYMYISSKIYDNSKYDIRPSDHYCCEAVIQIID